MKKRGYKFNLFMLCMLVVTGTTSIGFVRAQPQDVTIPVFDHATCEMYNYAKTTITIPCFQSIESCRMLIEGYADPDDPYLRCLRFFVDGNFTTVPKGRGGHIGVTCFARFQYGGYGVIARGQQKTWEFDMSNCQLAIDEAPYGHHYISFIPQNAEDTVGFFSPGEHTIQACITTEGHRAGPTLDTWISIILEFVLTPCVEGSLFSDALGILPLAILASSLIVLHWRRKY